MTVGENRPVGGSLIEQFEYGLNAPICLTWENGCARKCRR